MTFMKSVILVALSLFVGSVFAQNPPTISCGDYRVAQGNSCGQPGAVVYNHAGYPTNARIGGQSVQTGVNWAPLLASQAMRIPTGGQIPQGQCTWTERLQNILLSGGVGGLVGLLAGDNGRAAGQGAAAGVLIGTTIPCETKQKFLRAHGYNPEEEQSGELYQGGNTRRPTATTTPSSCNIEGMNPIHGVTAEDCAKLNGRMTVKVPSSCNIDGMNPIHGVSSEECAKLAGRMSVKVPATTKQVEVTPAYCRLTLTRNGVSMTKNVLNPERQQSYCDELPRALQNGTKTWENLQVVNL